MTTYKISKGTAWAKPNATRLRFTRKGIEWRGRFQLDYVAESIGVSFGDAYLETDTKTAPIPHGTTIKLVGLYPLSSAIAPFGIWNRMWAAWAAEWDRLAQKGDDPWGHIWKPYRAALRQFASTTHTDSWRVLATWEERLVPPKDTYPNTVKAVKQRGVALHLYLYDDARGAVFGNSSEIPHHGQEIAWLPEDPDKPGWTVERYVNLRVRHAPSILANGPHILVSAGQNHAIPLRRPWKYFGVSGSHANNGPGRRGAAVDLEWNAKLEVL